MRVISRTTLLVTTASLALAGGCDRRTKQVDAEPPPPPVSTSPVPPALVATPVAAFADAGATTDESPRDTARRYREGGQLWLARLVLEKTALSPSGEEADVRLLADICREQSDATCVSACEERLGRKVGDAGAPAPAGAKPAKPVRSRARGR